MSLSANTLEMRNNLINGYIDILRNKAYGYALQVRECWKDVSGYQDSLPENGISFDMLCCMVTEEINSGNARRVIEELYTQNNTMHALGYRREIVFRDFIRVRASLIVELSDFLRKQLFEFSTAFQELNDYQVACLSNSFKAQDVQDGYSWLIYTLLDNIEHLEHAAYTAQKDAIAYWESKAPKRAKLRADVKKMLTELD